MIAMHCIAGLHRRGSIGHTTQSPAGRPMLEGSVVGVSGTQNFVLPKMAQRNLSLRKFLTPKFLVSREGGPGGGGGTHAETILMQACPRDGPGVTWTPKPRKIERHTFGISATTGSATVITCLRFSATCFATHQQAPNPCPPTPVGRALSVPRSQVRMQPKPTDPGMGSCQGEAQGCCSQARPPHRPDLLSRAQWIFRVPRAL